MVMFQFKVVIQLQHKVIQILIIENVMHEDIDLIHFQNYQIMKPILQ